MTKKYTFFFFSYFGDLGREEEEEDFRDLEEEELLEDDDFPDLEEECLEELLLDDLEDLWEWCL